MRAHIATHPAPRAGAQAASLPVAFLLLAAAVACGGATQTRPAPAPGPITPTPDQPLENVGQAKGPAAGDATVVCQFDEGWASLVPADAFRQDEYLMQALIGLTEEPAFWREQEEYRDLEPYAARRCGRDGVGFAVPAGHYFLVVGRANTFDARGQYQDNGHLREVDLPAGGTIAIRPEDLTHTWSCISCPHIYAWNGERFEHRGEVLRDLVGPGAEKTQRTALGEVLVERGQVRLRLAEEEDEVSHVDALLLEIGGVTVAPADPTLAAADGDHRMLARGEAVELVYAVALPDGLAPAAVVATGYYVPLAGLR